LAQQKQRIAQLEDASISAEEKASIMVKIQEGFKMIEVLKNKGKLTSVSKVVAKVGCNYSWDRLSIRCVDACSLCSAQPSPLLLIPHPNVPLPERHGAEVEVGGVVGELLPRC
jgi:predicted secreted Zn-dependent protease